MSDYIKREDALSEMAKAECGVEYEECAYCSCSYICRIRDIPPADVRENVRGHWELKTSDLYGLADKVTAWANYCSVCGYHYGTPYNFCPNCGADMRGENYNERIYKQRRGYRSCSLPPSDQ